MVMIEVISQLGKEGSTSATLEGPNIQSVKCIFYRPQKPLMASLIFTLYPAKLRTPSADINL